MLTYGGKSPKPINGWHSFRVIWSSDSTSHETSWTLQSMVALGSPLATPTKRHATSLLLHQRTMLWRILPLKHVPMQCNGNKLCTCYLVYRCTKFFTWFQTSLLCLILAGGLHLIWIASQISRVAHWVTFFSFEITKGTSWARSQLPAIMPSRFFLLHPSAATSASLPKDDWDHDPWLEFWIVSLMDIPHANTVRLIILLHPGSRFV